MKHLINLYSLDFVFLSQVGHSLERLRVSHGLAASVSNIPSEALRPLTNVQYLDFSNNRLRSMPETSFHFLKRLRVLELQDNQIDAVQKGTFQVTPCTVTSWLFVKHSDTSERSGAPLQFPGNSSSTVTDVATFLGRGLRVWAPLHDYTSHPHTPSSHLTHEIVFYRNLKPSIKHL
jgi:hypothetical protein